MKEDDLVERLGHYARLAMPHYPHDLVSQAKTEIEILRSQIVKMREDTWAHGFNSCLHTAIQALNYLSSHSRPVGGQDAYNSEHLLQIADEIKKTIAHNVSVMNNRHKPGDTRGDRILEAIHDEVDQQLNPSGEDCPECGGEGYISDCFEEFACIDPELITTTKPIPREEASGTAREAPSTLCEREPGEPSDMAAGSDVGVQPAPPHAFISGVQPAQDPAARTPLAADAVTIAQPEPAPTMSPGGAGSDIPARPLLRVISLGAGVQSTTLALMAAHGEVGPMPDCAIFADTGEEPGAVYDHVQWLKSGNVLPFPVHIINTGPLGDRLFDDNEARIPVHTESGMRRRQCTKNYKLAPLRRKFRDLLGKGPRDYIAPGTVENWVGISTDEIIRVTPSRQRYITRRDPLIEKRMSRWDCANWLKDNGYPVPPKSSCVFCPYKGNAQWQSLRDHDPKGWARAVAIDERLRSDTGLAMFKKPTFLHRQAVPLIDADLSKVDNQINLFNNECEGMCGV